MNTTQVTVYSQGNSSFKDISNKHVQLIKNTYLTVEDFISTHNLTTAPKQIRRYIRRGHFHTISFKISNVLYIHRSTPAPTN